MNDFSEIESELKKLRPAQMSQSLLARVENAIVDLGAEAKIARPHAFRIHWMSLGVSLAAAALILIFLRFDFQKQTKPSPVTATNNPPPSEFIPSGTTRVVYHKRDEGLYFPADSEQPMRRVRSRTQETLQWRNPATGASLQVTYPAERVQLIASYGQ